MINRSQQHDSRSSLRQMPSLCKSLSCFQLLVLPRSWGLARCPIGPVDLQCVGQDACPVRHRRVSLFERRNREAALRYRLLAGKRMWTSSILEFAFCIPGFTICILPCVCRVRNAKITYAKTPGSAPLHGLTSETRSFASARPRRSARRPRGRRTEYRLLSRKSASSA